MFTIRAPRPPRSAKFALAIMVAVASVLGLTVVGLAPTPEAAGEVFDSRVTPRLIVADDPEGVELGMRFSPRTDGVIDQIRFYRSAANQGPHQGTLWSAEGKKLGTVGFASISSGDRPVGWQSATLRPAVAVRAGQTYVVSYHAPRGHYSADTGYFARSMQTPYLNVPAGAGVFSYGPTTFPSDTYENSNYYVDVRFRPSSSSTAGPIEPSEPTSASPTASSPLMLAQEPWYGGPAYYEKFPKARAAGWTDPSFFPIAVFFGKPSHAQALKALGINTFMGAEHDGSPVSDITKLRISLLAQPEWTSAEVGQDPFVVGWHASDECDMGLSGCSGGDQYYGLAIQRKYVTQLRAKSDGRFIQANFGNGVLGSYWSTDTMDDHLALVDVSSVDKYAYTSPHVQDLLRGSPYWPKGKNPASASAYGWQQKRMESFMSPSGSKPNWIFVETARPYLTEPGARTIAVPQIEGAVWAGIINGAAGVAYFQHNNDGSCGTYSLVECSSTLRDGVKRIDEVVRSLAPVINSPSYQWDFGPDLSTALKVHDGYAYVLAMTDGGAGSRQFKLPPGVRGQVTVVGENRTIAPVDGSFSDVFSAEYSHHIYRVALG